MSCNTHNPNLNRCGANPCATSNVNSAECESLPSQIQNFTTQFFGTVVKTEVDGQVQWSLPCSLDVGLPNNPRDPGEGLACYFLRLFEDGIIGLTGPKGDTGGNGTNGRNAYTVTLASFTQPTLGAPNVTIFTAYNPAILDSLYVFVATSGWYVVNLADPSGALFLTLVKAVDGASGTITAGKLVVPSGFPGASVQGGQGIQGPKGDTGDPATAFTTDNGMFAETSGTPYEPGVTYAMVDFVSSNPEATLGAIGKYLVTVVVGIVGLTGVAATDRISVKFYNSTDAGDVLGGEKWISDIAEDEEKQIIINALVETDSVNDVYQLWAKCTTASRIAIVPEQTTITFVRVE